MISGKSSCRGFRFGNDFQRNNRTLKLISKERGVFFAAELHSRQIFCRYETPPAAGKAARWEHGDLAEAVRALSAAIGKTIGIP
jgi:hypothetical protein